MCEAGSRGRGARRRTGLAVALMAAVLALPAAAHDATTIVRKTDEIRNPAPSYTVDVEIVAEQPGEAPTIGRYVVSMKDRVKSLIKFTDPPTEKGKLLLMVRQDMWYWAPTINRPIRISPLQRLLGQVSNTDIARANYSEDYEARLIGSEWVENRDCHVLDLRAKDEEISYHRIRYWVEKETFQPVKADYFALSDRLLKTAVFGAPRVSVGRLRPAELVIRDATRRDWVSTVRYSNTRVVTLSDSLFRQESLRSVR